MSMLSKMLTIFFFFFCIIASCAQLCAFQMHNWIVRWKQYQIPYYATTCYFLLNDMKCSRYSQNMPLSLCKLILILHWWALHNLLLHFCTKLHQNVGVCTLKFDNHFTMETDLQVTFSAETVLYRRLLLV